MNEDDIEDIEIGCVNMIHSDNHTFTHPPSSRANPQSHHIV